MRNRKAVESGAATVTVANENANTTKSGVAKCFGFMVCSEPSEPNHRCGDNANLRKRVAKVRRADALIGRKAAY